ncbi:hypothetical protein LguiA_027755 [Lonicera macranthoides]
MLLLTIGFVFGVLTVISLEFLGALFLLRRLTRRAQEQESKTQSSFSSGEVCRDNFDLSYPTKQGLVWVLEIEKVPKTWLTDKRPREQKRNKGIVEVTPVRKYAKLKDQSLILTESDGSHTKILLKDCTIEAVSATSLSSRKWAKRFPIKMENKTSAIYHGSRTLYIYLGTSWEKESWCKALRLSLCDNKQKLKWFSKLHSEFQSYLASLNAGYPSSLKPSIGYNDESIDKSVKVDGSSSKVRQLLKKLAKKASKSGLENTSLSDREERRISAKSTSLKEYVSTNGSVKPAPIGKTANYSDEEDTVALSLSSSTRSESPYASYDNIFIDEGTLCWNLLISRLFFDAKSNVEMKTSLQTRIQRTLSNMRIPSYMGEITCTGVHMGNLPPHICGMRVLPSDMNEAVALEIDIEYSGGMLLDITTRIEVRELDFPEADTNSESSSVGGVTSVLLEGFERFQKQLKISEEIASETEQKDEGDAKLHEMKTSKSTKQGLSAVSKWKSIVNSVAKQVSQVPLSLAIKVASLRGTLQLHIKSPPSDQLWFGFTTMPDVDFTLESFVGDHKITSGQIASFLINRFKAAIRDTMVLPNCESVGIPWMLAEKDDWVPREAAPFIWINKEPVVAPTSVPEVPRTQPSESTQLQEASKVTGINHSEVKHNKAKKVEFVDQPNNESSTPSLGPTNQSTLNEDPLQESRTPMLKNDQHEETSEKEENPESQSTSRSLVMTDEQNHTNEGDDSRLRKVGTRARMLGLGKKMGEKLEEKRRHLEEKGKIMVERMRAPENR